MFIAYRFPSIFLRRKTSDASNGYNKCTDLALGRPNVRFVLFFVNDGFHLGSTSMEHDFEEIWPTSKNYNEIVFFSVVSIHFL